MQVVLFGNFQIRTDTHDEVALRPTAARLFAFLLLNRQRVHLREVVAESFWQQAELDRARRRLNTTLWQLRNALRQTDDGQANLPKPYSSTRCVVEFWKANWPVAPAPETDALYRRLLTGSDGGHGQESAALHENSAKEPTLPEAIAQLETAVQTMQAAQRSLDQAMALVERLKNEEVRLEIRDWSNFQSPSHFDSSVIAA